MFPEDEIPVLGAHEEEVLADIRKAWESLGQACPSPEKLISLALMRMERDLRTGPREEILDDLRREAEYRAWVGDQETEQLTIFPGGESGR